MLADEINMGTGQGAIGAAGSHGRAQITVGKKELAAAATLYGGRDPEPHRAEGTYPLPEAQLDRFLLQLMVDYPSPTMELAILAAPAAKQLGEAPVTLSQTTLQRARSDVLTVTMQKPDWSTIWWSWSVPPAPGAAVCARRLEPLIAVGASPARHVGAGSLCPRPCLARGT